MPIYTHIRPDLDAACSVWAAQIFLGPVYDVRLVPANWDGSDAEEDAIILDLDAGVKGEKSSDGAVHSCFAYLVDQHADDEEKAALAPIVEVVEAQDTGRIRELYNQLANDPGRLSTLGPYLGLNSVLRALQDVYKNDLKAIEVFGDVLTGIYAARFERVRAESEADRADEVAPGAFVVRNPKARGVNGVLFERGAKVVVYVDGNNLGAVKSDQVTGRIDGEPVRSLTAGEDGWFFHPAGFLAARGRFKAPASSPSTVDPVELAKAAFESLSQ